jgi:hypothetical protein
MTLKAAKMASNSNPGAGLGERDGDCLAPARGDYNGSAPNIRTADVAPYPARAGKKGRRKHQGFGSGLRPLFGNLRQSRNARAGGAAHHTMGAMMGTLNAVGVSGRRGDKGRCDQSQSRQS